MATDAPTYRRTGTGYTTAEGEEKRTVRFYLNADQWAAYLREKASAGHTDNSAFIVAALGLASPEADSDEVSS